MRTVIVCLLAVSTAFAFPADEPVGSVGRAPPTQQGGCPGGYSEGQEIERGRLVYACQGGRVVPKGCVAEDLSKVPIGSKFDNAHYRRICQANGDDLTFEAVACIQNGQEHKAGETWEDEQQVYTCKQSQSEPVLDAVSTGCADGGKRLNPHDTTAKDNLLYECQPSVNKKFKLVPAGCVKDGKQLKPGETLEEGKLWYNCTKHGRETVSLKVAGCISNGRRLNDGDRFNDKDVMYECVIGAGKNDVRAVACVQNENGNTVERKLGCTWTEGAEPQQFEWSCKHDAAANTANKVQNLCNYKEGSGYHQIQAGCYRIIDKSAVACVREGEGLKYQTFQGDDAEKSAQSAGLHSC